MATEHSAPLGRQAAVPPTAAISAVPVVEPARSIAAPTEPTPARSPTGCPSHPRRGRLGRWLVSPAADAMVLLGLALLVRLPYQTNSLYHWDSVLVCPRARRL